MAIKISGTEVIDLNRNLQNITGANGTYGNFHGSVNTITTVINFATPMMALSMTGNVTFTESNKSAGRSAMLLLDTSSSGHTPTFSANIKWQGGAAPTWGDNRYWQIALQCIDGTTVRGVALGYESGSAPSEAIALSGSSGVGNPNTYFSALPIWNGSQWVQDNSFEFNSNGNVYRQTASNTLQINTADEWCNVTPTQTYYIRATNTARTGDTGYEAPNQGDLLNVWFPLTTTRSWGYLDTRTFGAYGFAFFEIKVEIASDSGGSNILDTGYYQFTWEGGA